jgi:hypothetical protein
MKLPVLKSPFVGLPDGQIQLPTKPVRLTLQPVEAIALFVALDLLTDQLEPTLQADPTKTEIFDLLTSIQGNLLDRLEVVFQDKRPREKASARSGSNA